MCLHFATMELRQQKYVVVFKSVQQSLSNSTFIMLYLVHEMHIDYLVVEETINIKIVCLQLYV
jgi:hypothetical protein